MLINFIVKIKRVWVFRRKILIYEDIYDRKGFVKK